MDKIVFGTDGWRAIIANEYTVYNVARVSTAVATWLLAKKEVPKVVIGYDCRFGGKLFAETTAKVFNYYGITTILSTGIVSTPMVSLATLNNKADMGIVITASHNPPEYNGYKLKGSYGGPLIESEVKEVEALIPDYLDIELSTLLLTTNSYQDLQKMYVSYVQNKFDIPAIQDSRFNWAYDAMYGAGQFAMRDLFPEITFLHCEHNPSFEGIAPEPLHKNLLELSELIQLAENIDCAFATDGDADRIGLYDGKGRFVDSHHIMLLLIKYLHKDKGLNGKIVTAFSASSRIEKLCKIYNLPYEVVKIGFKYIAPYFLVEDVLLGGEESGGIAVKGHIPERDGIWSGLLLWEAMAKRGKSLADLIDEVYALVGSFAYDRADIQVSKEQKSKVLALCKSTKGVAQIGEYKVLKMENLDGFKYFVAPDTWIMLRASGTEPVLRIYAEGKDAEEVQKLLQAAKETFLNTL